MLANILRSYLATILINKMLVCFPIFLVDHGNLYLLVAVEALSFKEVKIQQTLQAASLESFIELLRETAGNKEWKTAFVK